MKKLFATFLYTLLLTTFVAPLSAAPEFKEGTHYQLVTPPQAGGKDGRIQIREFFLYTCPHCYRLEPHLKKWLESKPENVDFDRIPAMFKRSTLIMHANTYYALELMGAAPAVHEGIFDALHAKKLKLNSQADVESYLEGQGIDIARYRKSMKSFGVKANAGRAEQLLRKFDIRGVPAIIVDGKYLVSGLEGGPMVQVTNFLIDKVQKEKAAK